MARYFALLGRRVEVRYRAGDLLLPATGTLAADSGKSIFLEEHFSQHGKEINFRWEIPYQHIVRLSEIPTPADPPEPAPADRSPTAARVPRMLRLKDRPREA